MIYLAGPYRSSTLAEHNHNIGRLYTYYVYLTLEMPTQMIVCLPLCTAGFERLDTNMDDSIYLDMCCDFIRATHPICAFTIGWVDSKGCMIEHKVAEKLKLPTIYPNIYTKNVNFLKETIHQIGDRSPFYQHGLMYLDSL